MYYKVLLEKMFPSVSYGRELPPKSMYLAFILTLFILDAWLYVLHSFFFLFILYSCLYVNAYISHGFSIHSYFNFFLVFFFTFSILRWFVSFFLCNPYFLHSYCYWFILNHISIWNISSPNHQSTNTKHEAESMKTNTFCMNLLLYYDVRRHYNRYNCCSH